MGKISVLLLVLIQAQAPPRLSKVVIAGAVLVLVVGLSLLIYFFRRYKTTEKEAQDEWDRPEQSLFGGVAPPLDRIETGSKTRAAGTVENLGFNKEIPAPAEEAPIAATPASRPETETRPATQELKSDQPPILAAAPVIEARHHATEILSSTANEAEILSNKAVTEPGPIDDDLSARVLASEKVPESTKLLGVEGTGDRISSDQPASDVPVSVETAIPEKTRGQTELLGAARVDARPPREPFEPPSITPIVHREHWDTPNIEPLKPRAQPPAPVSQPIKPSTQILASPPVVMRQSAGPVAELSSAQTQHPVVARAGARNATIRVPSGSVLGLPAEPSDAPLVYGKPTGDAGIGDFSNPWKAVDSGGGHGGTIALAVVVLLIGGAIAAYLFLPAVNTRVNAMVARARGIDPNPPPSIEQPKARVFPARNEANKNIVKARGAVDNISEETLSNLSVEVSLERGNGASPELRRVPVTPAQLTPRQRGVFEFEYDGNRANGFSGYRIVRLVSGEDEIKFTTPGRAG